MTDAPHHHPLEDYIPAETVEHLKAARAEMRKSLETVLPPGFLEHRRAARREMLLAARSFIDAALKRSEPPSRGTTV
jgi:hypothetical protein